MKKNFINVQLFGDPAGDPKATAPDPTGNGAQTPGPVGDDATPNAAQELIEFKRKYVSREQYEAEKQRADGYLAAILNNREDEVAASESSESAVDATELAKELFVEDNKMSDIEYASKVLAQRKAVLEAGGEDPFLPHDPEDRDYEIAQNVADVFEDCIKAANGNNATFIALLQSRIKETQTLPKFNRR